MESFSRAAPVLLDLGRMEGEADALKGSIPELWGRSTSDILRCPKCGHKAMLKDFQTVTTEKSGRKKK